MTVVGIIAGFFILFFGYLFYQYFMFTKPPYLEVKAPREGEVIAGETVTVAGKTDADAVVSVNNQKIALGQEGEFTTKLILTPGVNTIVVESVSKYGKKKTINRTIQIKTSVP